MLIALPRRLALALCLLLLAMGASGAALRPAIDTSSPAATYTAFLAETQRIEGLFRAYRADPGLSAQLVVVRAMIRLGEAVFDLDDFAPDHRWKDGARSVALLVDILNRIPAVPPEAFPSVTGPNPPARWTIPGTELTMTRVESGPRSGDYVFSAETVARLPEFRAMVEGDPVLHSTEQSNWTLAQQQYVGPLLHWMPVQSLPGWMHATPLGAPLWKVMFLLGCMFLAGWLFLLWNRWLMRASVDSTGMRKYALRLTGPILLAVLTAIIHFIASLQLVLPSPIGDWETTLAMILLYLSAAWAAWISCWLLAEVMIASPIFPDDLYDANLLRLLAPVSSLVAATVMIIYGANDIGVPAVGLLAGVSVGGIALALAAQSTVENLFGGVSIFADRPFRVGDFIRYGHDSGTVETIGPRSSRIRGLDGTLTAVPNADLAKMQLTNFTARDKTLFHHKIGVRYETSREQLQQLLETLRHLLGAHPSIEKSATLPRVRLVGLGSSSVDIEIFAKVLVPDLASFLVVQEELIIGIMRAVEECGTGFAFPSTTTYVARDPGLEPGPAASAGATAPGA